MTALLTQEVRCVLRTNNAANFASLYKNINNFSIQMIDRKPHQSFLEFKRSIPGLLGSRDMGIIADEI